MFPIGDANGILCMLCSVCEFQSPRPGPVMWSTFCAQDLYGVRSDLGNLFKALGRLEDAKVHTHPCTNI